MYGVPTERVWNGENVTSAVLPGNFTCLFSEKLETSGMETFKSRIQWTQVQDEGIGLKTSLGRIRRKLLAPDAIVIVWALVGLVWRTAQCVWAQSVTWLSRPRKSAVAPGRRARGKFIVHTRC